MKMFMSAKARQTTCFGTTAFAAEKWGRRRITCDTLRVAVTHAKQYYDVRSLFPRQVFLPMAGKGKGWQKLKKDIKAELNEDLLEQLHSTVSLPFAAGDNRKIAVKIIDDRGIESLKVMRLE